MTRTADEIANEEFPLVRRGFDPVLVRAFLTELADEVADPARAAASSRVEELLADAERAAQTRIDAADEHVAAAELRLAELTEQAAALEVSVAEADDRYQRNLRTQEEEANRTREQAALDAAALLDEARAEAEAAYRGRWQEAGGMVTRILESAEAEAAQLTEAAELAAAQLTESAESLAVEMRSTLQAEVTRTRAEAERHAAEVRSRASEFADARLASAESEREQALESLAAAKAEAERVEAEGTTRAAATVRRAEEAVKAHVGEQLATARQELDRLRADEVEITARLGRVRELVDSTLAIEPDVPRPRVDEPAAFLLRLAADGDADEETEGAGGDDGGDRPYDAEQVDRVDGDASAAAERGSSGGRPTPITRPA